MTAVLVVDDDAVTRALLGRWLQPEHEVKQAATTAEAIATLNRGSIDVMITDLHVDGDRDGLQLLRYAQQNHPKVQTVLISASASAKDHNEATDLGAVQVLTKPLAAKVVTTSVRQALECAQGFRAVVHGLSLIDILQLFHLARRSVAISLSGNRPGLIFIQDGDVTHAEYGGVTGPDALCAMLATPAGFIRTQVLPAEPTRTINESFDEVLFDSLRRIDEGFKLPDEPAPSASLPAEPPAPRQASMAPPPPRPVALAGAELEALFTELASRFDGPIAIAQLSTGSILSQSGVRGELPQLEPLVKLLIAQTIGAPTGSFEWCSASLNLAIIWSTFIDIAVLVAEEPSTQRTLPKFRIACSATRLQLFEKRPA